MYDLSEIDGMTRDQREARAIDLNNRVVELIEDVERIDVSLKSANLQIKEGAAVDLDWLHRARYAASMKRSEIRKAKLALKHVNVTIRGGQVPELTELNLQNSSVRKRLHEETLRTVNIKREMEVERIKLAAAKAEQSDSIKFMKAARGMLDPELFSTIAKQAGITADPDI